jgi:DNA-binding CsgD family transcriptional regulator
MKKTMRRMKMKNSNDPSPAEMRVLKVVAEGLSNQEMAERLGLSVPTVKAHMHSLFLKFRVNNRAALVTKARKKGFLAKKDDLSPDEDSMVLLKPNIEEEIETLLDQAERNAWKALARYKFIMFGYWAAIWVYHNKISPHHHSNPFKELVDMAKEKVSQLV